MDHHLENEMKKLCATAMLMASLGLLAACQDSPEDKMESARESMSDAAENIGDAMEDTGEAIEQRTDEAFDNEPTTTERLQDNLDAAGDRISEAYEDSADYLEEKGEQVRESAAEARDNIEERLDRIDPTSCCIPRQHRPLSRPVLFHEHPALPYCCSGGGSGKCAGVAISTPSTSDLNSRQYST